MRGLPRTPMSSGSIPAVSKPGADLTGQTFGHWLVLARTENDHVGRKQYLCRCSCGVERIVPASNLLRGLSTSCGHPGRAKRRSDLTGQRFGRLVAIRYVCRRGENSIWECECDCGSRCECAANNLKDGHTQSCGCQRAEAQSDQTARKLGQAASPKCGKVDTNARAKSFVLTDGRRSWEGRNLSNFVRKHGDLFGIDPTDEYWINRIAQELYTTRRNNTTWHGWHLEWTDDD